MCKQIVWTRIYRIKEFVECRYWTEKVCQFHLCNFLGNNLCEGNGYGYTLMPCNISRPVGGLTEEWSVPCLVCSYQWRTVLLIFKFCKFWFRQKWICIVRRWLVPRHGVSYLLHQPTHPINLIQFNQLSSQTAWQLNKLPYLCSPELRGKVNV